VAGSCEHGSEISDFIKFEEQQTLNTLINLHDSPGTSNCKKSKSDDYNKILNKQFLKSDSELYF
jgi:hypothetical protein